MVLFGVPESAALEEAFGRDNPVWKAVGSLLGRVSWGVVFGFSRIMAGFTYRGKYCII